MSQFGDVSGLAAFSRGVTGSGGPSVEADQLSGRRLAMLHEYAPEFTTASPATALEMAQGSLSDDEMLRAASESVEFSNYDRIWRDLQSASGAEQRAIFASLPAPIAEQFTEAGYEPPEPGSGGRLFGSIPVLGDVTRMALDWGEIPGVGGAAEEAQHFLGEGAQGVGQAGGFALNAMEAPLRAVQRGIRATDPEIRRPTLNPLEGWRDFSAAWDAVGDDYIRPSARRDVSNILEGKPRRWREIAKGLALGKSEEDIVASFGFEPGTQEAAELAVEMQEALEDSKFQEAVRRFSTGQASLGRILTQDVFGIGDTDAGFGRILSGTIDAGTDVVADPLILAGAPLKAARFGRFAFTVENAADMARGFKYADLALIEHAGRQGIDTARYAARLERFNALDARRGRQVLAWADRVSKGFREESGLASLMRDLPDTSTAMGALRDAHVTRTAAGLPGLDTTTGVLEWLRSRDGILALAGSRLGGGQSTVRGLRIPALTTQQRAALRTKEVWQSAIDTSRLSYTPALRDITRELGNPRELSRQIGRFVNGAVAGSGGRALAALTSHTPYVNAVALHGNDAVPEFTRLVNTGIFVGLDRPTMDAYIDAFARGDFTERATQIDSFIETLFTRAGIADTEFARTFIGRHRQAYGIRGADMADVDGTATHMARLVDGHHADMMSVPDFSEFLRGSAKENVVRHIFQGHPASWTNAALGRFWKPSVLMRLGFIPRAAGEELLHWLVKMGPRSWIGAKGADWAVQAEERFDLVARLEEARALGQVDEVNRLEQGLAATDAFVAAPFRSLLGAMDRGFTHLFAARPDDRAALLAKLDNQGIKALTRTERLWVKQHALDERGVVSGMEMLANHLTLRGAGYMQWAARKAHVPTRAEAGAFLAERWNPGALDAARHLAAHPAHQRAYLEEISGSHMTPWEFAQGREINGAPVRTVRIREKSGGVPVVQEVELRPVPGTYKEFDRAGVDSDPAFWNSLYSNHKRIQNDRIASNVLERVLPNYIGGDVAKLPDRLGMDHATLRGELNDLYSFSKGSMPTSKMMPDADVDELAEAVEKWEKLANGDDIHRAMRQLVDDPDGFDDAIDEASDHALDVFERHGDRRGWLAWAIREASDSRLHGKNIVRLLSDPKVSRAEKHWMLYKFGDPDRQINNWRRLERSMRRNARHRAVRPDITPRLREMRLYTGEKLAKPTQDKISKVYVPLTDGPAEQLGTDFVDAATEAIVRIGGYHPDNAARIAQEFAEASTLDRINVNLGVLHPLSAWGAQDPRVADALLEAAEQVTGVKGRFGIIEVPDEAVRRSVGSHPLGLRSTAENWTVADGFHIDPWQLQQVQPTEHTRQLQKLNVGDDWWDAETLDAAKAAFDVDNPARRFSTDGRTWVDEPPADGPFMFMDGDDADIIHKLPGRTWKVTDTQVSDGIPEAQAVQRVSDSTVDEVIDWLTTRRDPDMDDDVLHEIVEPLLRGDRVYKDAAGNKIVEYGYDFRHLTNARLERLPRRVYGPELVASRDLKWDRFVQDWFSGPVQSAISSIIRKPMFLQNFGESLTAQRGIADMFVHADTLADALKVADKDELDLIAHYSRQVDIGCGDWYEAVEDILGLEDGLGTDAAAMIGAYAKQKVHGLNVIDDNAMNRAMQLTIPYIDDHNIRSAFQGYIGNFVPFLFAEEQFLKRWGRSIAESPEMIRKMQLGMNGLRSMGVVREDGEGRTIFNYPLVGMAAEQLSKVVAPVFGDSFRIPYPIQMTGDVGYALPGLGQQFGVPSGGPIVGVGIELLSRHFPELADVEQIVNERGADRNLWEYVVPSALGNIYKARLGDVDTTEVGSAVLQAMQTRAVNGDLPPEGASPEEMEAWIDETTQMARAVMTTRALFGMVAPAAPQVETEGTRLSDEFQEILQSGVPIEEAFTLFAAKHPDMEPADLVGATVSRSEQEYGGLGQPTDKAFDWMNTNSDLISAFPAAASWLIPQADRDDPFSHRAYHAQLARGLRKRKTPQEFLNDIYFQKSARDYFDERTEYEAAREGLTPMERRLADDEWEAWKDAYMVQHPVFHAMLSDPTRQQRRAQVLRELTTLAADETAPVPDEMRELLARFDEYQMDTVGLRGDRRTVAVNRRNELTQEFVTWARWQVQKYPHLSGLYLRVIEKELGDLGDIEVV